MKKFTFLMLLLSMAAGASAKIITSAPKANTPYKIKCIATDHTGYLGDDKTTLQGRHATGTFFVLEQVEGKEGQYYLKSEETDKYINAADATNGAAITFEDKATTYWTLDQTNAVVDRYSWAIRPNGTAGFSLNNNGAATAACPYMKVISHTGSGQGCALWTFDDGLPYDELEPELPVGKYIHVSLTKADHLIPAESASDNEHWYLLTQARGGETPSYDDGNTALKRAAVGTQVAGKLISGNERYLVRFFEDDEADKEGLYLIQFATGNFVTPNLTTGSRATSGTFNFYNIKDQETHFGWNKPEFANRVDNNGAGSNIVYWESGKVDQIGGNNDWSLYAVDFVDGVNIEYTIYHAELDAVYKGSYTAGWNDKITAYPDLAGAAGYTLNSANFDKDGDNYSMTANITFPFPVGENVTGIESELGNSKWFVNGDDVIKASNANTSDWDYQTQDNYQWHLYPSFTNGTFSFKIKHHKTEKYIPKNVQALGTDNKVIENADDAGLFYLVPCVGNGVGFSVDESGTEFLSINSNNSNQSIGTWKKTTGATHTGSNLSFPNVTVTKEDLQEQVGAMASITPFEILDGSIVVGPSEFANPKDINAAIEAAGEVDMDEIEDMYNFTKSEEAKKIQNYLAQVRTYGELHNYQFDFSTKKYRTIILPCPSTRPAGIKLYSCSEEDGVLTLTEINGNFGFNVPYLIEHTGDNGKYTIIGWRKKQDAETYTAGCLTGVLKEGGLPVPDNSYKFDFEHQRFVKNAKNADEETEVSPVAYSNESETIDFTCYQHECYLTPEMEADDMLYIKDNGTVSIADIFVDRNGKTEIYDLNGRRLPSLQKGINIVNGHKILVK